MSVETPRQFGRSERIAWLRLARTPSVGGASFEHLLRRHGTATAALAALPGLARRAGGGDALRIPAAAAAEAELAAGEAIGARTLASIESAYPARLAAIDAPPPLLWLLGDAGLLAKPAIAIVGARVASAAGQRFARDLARDLGEAGLIVVSGLARGIDAAAHAGSLATGAVAVLAGGVDQPYPEENRALYERIAERGCVVSERAIGHVAKAKDFPRRNRIVSGLALGVVVVEAELRSGSLITARLAGEQGRDVFAVPGSPLDPRSRGANDLIRQGAVLVETAEDVLRVLDPASAGVPAAAEPAPADRFAEDGDDEAVRERIAAALSPTPTSIDELARRAGVSPAAATAALVELSVAGRAEMLGGGLVSSS